MDAERRRCTVRVRVGIRRSASSCSTGGVRLNCGVQRGHNRSFQPYSPMGWRVALRSGRVHKLCQRLRSSGSTHRSHRQLRRARTIRHGPGRASGRANWCGDGPGRPRPTRGRHTRRPGGRVVCTGIDNPGSNVFPASRPVWQWGGTRYNFDLVAMLMSKQSTDIRRNVEPTEPTLKQSWSFCWPSRWAGTPEFSSEVSVP